MQYGVNNGMQLLILAKISYFYIWFLFKYQDNFV